MHTDFAQLLQVLFLTELDAFRTPDAEISAKQLLEECQQSTKDLCTMLLEYFVKHIVLPCHDIFEQATQVWVYLSHPL